MPTMDAVVITRKALAWFGLIATLVAPARLARADDGGPVAITHARVYLPNGRAPLDDATLVLAGGKVQAVGAAVRVPAGARVIDARGKVVTPGFIDADTALGIVDVELELQTSETDTRGPMVPALRAVDGRRSSPSRGRAASRPSSWRRAPACWRGRAPSSISPATASRRAS